MGVNSSFWKGKKVLVTGHTGFKGAWLSLWLQNMGAEVTGISLEPPTDPSLYSAAQVAEGMTSLRADIRDLSEIKAVFAKHRPEIVFHLAAQSLVRKSYEDPVETYSTNVMGTLNILEAIRAVGNVRAAVLVTTDKCYENKEWYWGYRENDPMGGYDPYSSSKGCAELLIASYRNSYFSIKEFNKHKTAISSVRAGNVIGGGDWASDRLIPDMIKNFEAERKVEIRNPGAIRPWQHVLEPLAGYLLLAEKMIQDGETYSQAWNFGPNDEDARPVKFIVEKISQLWGQTGETWTENGAGQPHEAMFLKLDCSKSKALLGWKPRLNLEEALGWIVNWHKEQARGVAAKELCLRQIKQYEDA